MGKPKIKRKSTLIDMTAMSDVTVLLLTFFMLTSTFLSKEPALVQTPSSVSEEKVPMENLVTVLVSGANSTGADNPVDRVPEGKVFIGITGSTDSVFSNEKIRRDVLLEALRLYNEQPKHASNKVGLTEDQILAFTKIGMFGVPMKELPAFLSLSTQQQDALYKYDIANPAAYAGVGIPYDENKNPEESAFNEFQIWMRAINNVALDYKNNGKLTKTADGKEEYKTTEALFDVIKRSGQGIAIKGDKDTPYSTIHPILDNLQTVKLNKFTLVTALKTEAD